MAKTILIALLSLTLLPAALTAGEEGYSGGQFLRLGGGARTAALGDAGTAAAGADALFYNPAGLARTDGTELMVSHTRWILDLNYSNIAVAREIPDGGYGAAVSYLAVPSTVKYDKTGARLQDSYSASDIALAFGYARKAGAATSLGASLKYIRSALEEETASAVAIDLGLSHAAVKDKLTLAFAVQNVGTRLKYIDEETRLPLTLKFGGAYTFNVSTDRELRKDISLFADLNHLKDSGPYAGAGVDFITAYRHGASFSVRAGYRTNTAEDVPGFSAGLSVKSGYYDIEYAYAPMGDLGNTHRFSLKLKLGSTRPRG